MRLRIIVGGSSQIVPRSARETDPFWDPASRQFHPLKLHAAVMARGWAARDFAADPGISLSCLYGALRRFPVRDSTVVRVIGTLETRVPSELVATGRTPDRASP